MIYHKQFANLKLHNPSLCVDRIKFLRDPDLFSQEQQQNGVIFSMNFNMGMVTYLILKTSKVKTAWDGTRPTFFATLSVNFKSDCIEYNGIQCCIMAPTTTNIISVFDECYGFPVFEKGKWHITNCVCQRYGRDVKIKVTYLSHKDKQQCNTACDIAKVQNNKNQLQITNVKPQTHQELLFIKTFQKLNENYSDTIMKLSTINLAVRAYHVGKIEPWSQSLLSIIKELFGSSGMNLLFTHFSSN